MTDKLRLPNVTVLAVDGVDARRAIRALERCRKLVEFGDAVIATGLPTGPLPPGMRRFDTGPIPSLEAYSATMLDRLPEMFATDYVLVVQYDGYVVNADAWSPRFLDCDYIGAVWPAGTPQLVGNGGFSLRSRRLCEAVARLPRRRSHPEDNVVCMDLRADLEGLGMRFATPDVAGRFSVEPPPGSPALAPKSFGFHSRMLHALKPWLRAAVVDRQPRTIFTHCGKMGDMFQCALPIASHHYRTTGRKPWLALAEFPYVDEAVRILELQPCLAGVLRADFEPRDFNCGGQPWKFARNAIEGYAAGDHVVHLGFAGQPRKDYVSHTLDSAPGCGIDRDFVLNLGVPVSAGGGTVVCDRWPDRPLLKAGVTGDYLDGSTPLLEAMQRAMGADTVVSATTATAVILAMAGKRLTAMGRAARRHAHMEWIYGQMPGRVEWRNLPEGV